MKFDVFNFEFNPRKDVNHISLKLKIYLIDLPKVDAIRSRPRVLRSGQKGTNSEAKVTANYFTASQDASDSYLKVFNVLGCDGKRSLLVNC